MRALSSELMRPFTERASVLCIATAVVTACSGGPPPTSAERPERSAAAAPEATVLEIRVVSADLDGRMVNGQHWDPEGQKSDVSPPTLARYYQSHPELSETRKYVGIPVDDPELEERADYSKAADPMVLVEVGDQVFRSPIRPRAFQPNWDFVFHFATTDPDNTPIYLQVLDYDDADHFDPMGVTVISAADLLRQPVHKLARFGAVENLILQVRQLPPKDARSEPASTELAIPGRPTWTDTGIAIVAGQRVRIVAADEVCTTLDDLETCSGPEGQSDRNRYNHPGFEFLGHGALIAALGDTRFPVGRDIEFVAPATGVLRLGINDEDYDNNKGSYAVQVVVFPAGAGRDGSGPAHDRSIK